MADPISSNPLDYIDKQIPVEILEQLKVFGRIKFTPQPTTVSAVSTVGSKEDQSSIDDAVAVSGVLNHIGEMENLASQIEDMIDALIKDMAIPVPADNKSLQEAVKNLGGTDTITKDVFDTAQAIINQAPILLNGYDPVLTALTGDGKINGDYLNCSQVTKSIAKAWNTAAVNTNNPEKPILDETAKIADEYEKSLGQMILEILQMFFFNMIWPKYLVDLGIINPARLLVGYPLDGLICFFKKMCDKKRFSIKSKECLTKNGPINKILNKLRCLLMCVPPAKLWDIKKFKPMVKDFDCKCEELLGCPPDDRKDGPDESESSLGGLGNVMDSLFPDKEACVDVDSIIGKVTKDKNDNLGISPECLKSAKIVLEAVVADALSPQDPSRVGLAGGLSAASIVKDQVAGLN